MDFENIFLTEEELKRLKELAKSGKWERHSLHEKGLREHGLVDRMLFRNPDGSSAGLHSKISDKGMIYLKRLEREKKEKRSDRFHDWILAIVSLILGALLSSPLWSWIGSLFD